ncbi:hypothetical protein U9M48_021527 [Paspalum notatum var. saurae]|uniref:Uncharacterized protein n=1 Tax=Paspalum notatum var. saurae TaxID=547442 RepID=A0AAQ3THQ0_PASNO
MRKRKKIKIHVMMLMATKKKDGSFYFYSNQSKAYNQEQGNIPRNISRRRCYVMPILLPSVRTCNIDFGVQTGGVSQTYLGLPLSNTKLKLDAFNPLIAKADKYLAGWLAALLNSMGRLVLVNAVLDSQLIYHMSSLLLAPGIIKQVDRRRRGFLWSGTGQTSGAKCLVAWEEVQQSKADGGLGVKKLGGQNICLLMKLLHQLHTASSSSWVVWVRGQVCLATLKGSLVWDVLRSLLCRHTERSRLRESKTGGGPRSGTTLGAGRTTWPLGSTRS